MQNSEIQHQLSLIDKEIIRKDRARLLLVAPESAGDIFLITSLLPSISETYADYDIYLACKNQYRAILANNPYLTNTIPYYPVMDNQILMEGQSKWKGLFDISIMVTAFTQRMLNYINNGQTRIALKLKRV